MKGIQVCLNEGPCPFATGDNNKRVKYIDERSGRIIVIDFVPTYVLFKTKHNYLYLNELALTAWLIVLHISYISYYFFLDE